MAKLLASMIATLKLAPTKTGTNMFSFKTFVNQARGSKGSKLSLCSLAFGRPTFTWAAPLTAFMTSTVQSSFAGSHTFWLFFFPLMADGRRLYSTTPTANSDYGQAGHTCI